MAFDTHAAVKALTAAGASSELAEAVVDIARDASTDQERDLATKADLVALEARLAWRLITAGIAIAGIAVVAGVALTAAILRLLI
ncbi:MAG: DUF1640 domain-containing protein [Acidobacteria bacterium]|nr:DUF1640 domain-containing protein [Acidobacteriota bacterium]